MQRFHELNLSSPNRILHRSTERTNAAPLAHEMLGLLAEQRGRRPSTGDAFTGVVLLVADSNQCFSGNPPGSGQVQPRDLPRPHPLYTCSLLESQFPGPGPGRVRAGNLVGSTHSAPRRYT